MEALKEYLISVIAVSVFCAIINSLVGKKGTVAPLLKLVSGIIITITVIKPFIQLRVNGIYDYIESFSNDALYYSQSGENSSAEARIGIIKSKAQAYILDKAASLDVAVEVEVVLTDTEPYVPREVHLHGVVSPYAKKQLSDYIAETFAIGKEAQIWTG